MSQEPELLPPSEPVSPVLAAVNRCMAAYKMAYRAAGTMGADRDDRHNAGCDAYRLALPLTQTEIDVQAFINCVTYGIAIGAIDGPEPSQLLYAAQVALSAIKRKPGKG
jgi:hypothetical protein